MITSILYAVFIEHPIIDGVFRLGRMIDLAQLDILAWIIWFNNWRRWRRIKRLDK